MALINPSSIGSLNNIWDKIDITTKEYAIGGKLITAKYMVSDQHSATMNPNDIKENLMHQMIEYIIKNKLVEFTKIPDMYSGSSTYLARIYLTPDDQVKILRTYGK
jgi:hypothetical protein